jgi:multiple sugar transport system permease protein
MQTTRRSWFSGQLVMHAALYVALLVGAVVMAFPYYWMLVSSFKIPEHIFSYPPQLLPEAYLGNYENLFAWLPFLRNAFNSLVIAVGGTSLSLFFASLAGFGFAKYRFKGRNVLFYIMLATMMIPEQVAMIPNFIILTRLHWVNTYWALILPGAAGAFGIFLMRQYIATVPDELIDAARMDGCSEFRIYYFIVVPIILPALATLSIFTFTGHWNDFMWPFIILRTDRMLTLPVALGTMVGKAIEIPWGVIMAGSTLTVTPLIIVFIFLQRYFLGGLTLGAVKG